MINVGKDKGHTISCDHRSFNIFLFFFIFTCAKRGLPHDVAYLSLVVRKPVFEVSDQVRHKPGCKTTHDG